VRILTLLPNTILPQARIAAFRACVTNQIIGF
jgi:hypothetical protein